MITRAMFLVIFFSIVALAACSPLAMPAIPSDTRTPSLTEPGDVAISPTIIIEPFTSVPTPLPAEPDQPVSNEPGGTPVPLPTNPYQPRPGDERFARSSAFIDTSDLLVRESFPPQYSVWIKGTVPTPCHEVRALVKGPDTDGRIDIDVYSLADPEKVCVQVLAEFDMTIPLGSLSTGSYEVVVNGKSVGQIAVP